MLEWNYTDFQEYELCLGEGNIILFPYKDRVEVSFYDLDHLYKLFCSIYKFQYNKTNYNFHSFTLYDNVDNVKDNIEKFLDKAKILLPFI